jgi:hypothetical protein
VCYVDVSSWDKIEQLHALIAIRQFTARTHHDVFLRVATAFDRAASADQPLSFLDLLVTRCDHSKTCKRYFFEYCPTSTIKILQDVSKPSMLNILSGKNVRCVANLIGKFGVSFLSEIPAKDSQILSLATTASAKCEAGIQEAQFWLPYLDAGGQLQAKWLSIKPKDTYCLHIP